MDILPHRQVVEFVEVLAVVGVPLVVLLSLDFVVPTPQLKAHHPMEGLVL